MKEPKHPRDTAASADQVWAEITRFYKITGVEATALELQDQRGANVLLLLYLCWLEAAGRRPRAGVALPELLAAGRWRRVFLLKPVRALRRGLFTKPGGKTPVKTWLLGVELFHERALLAGYIQLSRPLQAGGSQLLGGYLRQLGVSAPYEGDLNIRDYFENIRVNLGAGE